LRRALGDASTQPQYIATLAKRGYRFVHPVTVIPAAPTAAPAPEPIVAPDTPADRAPAVVEPSSRTPVTSLPPWPLPAAAIALIAAAIGGFLFMRREPAARRTPVVLSVNAPAGTALVSGGILSPDSMYLAFVARDRRSGRTQLWTDRLDTGTVRALPGTEN